MTQQDQPQQTDDRTSTHNTDVDEAAFAVAPDDPRSTQVRGGLEADLGGVNDHPTEVNAAGEGAANLGTTSADLSATQDDAGAVGTGAGTANSGQLTMNTTGLFAPHSGPPGVGPVEGSRTGIEAPQVEMTDIGLVDVNMVDMSVTGDDDNIQGGGARVEDEDGNPL
ncbi:MAG TPA: hypothetical protein VF600_00585 [Abditibacteriaceae bacterium]|jgi:hypothetical protein